MKHYRLYKLSKRDGKIVKAKDLEETNDDAAIERAKEDDDCPDCELWQAERKVGSVTAP